VFGFLGSDSAGAAVLLCTSGAESSREGSAVAGSDGVVVRAGAAVLHACGVRCGRFDGMDGRA
jgi:hypothetical protein